MVQCAHHFKLKFNARSRKHSRSEVLDQTLFKPVSAIRIFRIPHYTSHVEDKNSAVADRQAARRCCQKLEILWI